MKLYFRMMIPLAAIVALAAGCGGRMPEEIGASHGVLTPCHDKPNCVSSFAEDTDHHADAFAIVGTSLAAWQGLQSILEAESNVEIVTKRDDYLHAVYTSTLMRYRDDVEFLMREREGVIALRSASRVGHSDMGVNRDRIETLRKQLAEMGLVESASSD
jgi:uncharacterized protein (DUF1499 family)